ncbi:MAG: HRDC domain-containing protein [Paludibacteraceae bacterium]|nr:HRDC domain-containing protein [Paludibacteraceae bacterium]
MKRHFICLANSYKYGGRCLAGIEIELSANGRQYRPLLRDDGNPRWIRPVQKGAEHESIAIETAQNIRLLDILEIEVSEACGGGCQGENVYFKSLKIISHLKCDNEHILPLCSEEIVVLNSPRTYLTESEYQRGNHSLMLIRPEKTSIFAENKQTDDGQQKRKYYAKFVYCGIEYKLPITAPEYLSRMESYSPIALTGEFPTGTFYFTISIAAEPWNGVHHKLLAGIIDMRLVPKTDQRDDAAYQSEAYRLAEEFSERTNRCLFITGKAGTGKTTFLKRLREVSPKNIAVVAPTGVAAINAGGMTIHSFFQLPIRTLLPTPQSNRQIFAEQRLTQRKRQMLYHLEMLVIDEISMVRADVLDAIDAVLRHYRYRRDVPFGGVQVVMIGDLMQLQPVVNGDEQEVLERYYEGPYFFQSKVMQEVKPVYIELDHVFRQQNADFVRILNEVRENRLSAQSRAMLAARYMQETPALQDDDFHITLTTHNQQADDLNHRRLAELDGREYTFKAEVKKNFPESSYPTEETLTLKEGARVMFIRNDDQKPRRFYNGKLGIVANIGDNAIIISCEDGEIEVEPMTWENIRYKENAQSGKIEEELLGTFKQYPLRLAWAITIHKSQGLTFDKVIIDAARAFAAGQVYVALSRCRTLEGIILSSPLQQVSLGNDKQVLNYVSSQPTIEQSAAILGSATKEYQLQLFSGIYDVNNLLTMVEQLQRHVAKCVSFNAETQPFLDELKRQILEMADVSDKFQKQLTKIIYSDRNDIYASCDADGDVRAPSGYLQHRMMAAAGYFAPRVQNWADIVSRHPCRCKNKADASDFDTIINDLYLMLAQKAALMQAVAKEPTTDAYLTTKSKFVATPMQTQSVFGKPVKNKTKEAKVANSNEQQEDKKLFERLRQLRLLIAKEDNVPAYIVFSDKTLHELATYKPTTLSTFEQVNGVGKKKIESYGERFVMSICEYLNKSYTRQDAVSNTEQTYMQEQKDKYEKAYAKWTLEEEQHLTEMKQSGFSIKTLVEVLKRNKGGIISRLRKLGLED